MSYGNSSPVILITLFLAFLTIVLPVNAANTTVDTTIDTNQTTVPPTEPPVATTVTTGAITETSVAATLTANVTNKTTVVSTQTTVSATPTTLTPTTTTAAITRPTTVVSPSNPATPVTSAITTGDVIVYSSPAGASFLIDGVYCGTTPNTVHGVSAGNHILRLTLSGYNDYEGSIYVVAGEATQGYGTLQPIHQVVSAAPTPTMVVPVIVPVVTVTPESTQDTGLMGNSSVIVAIIGAIGVIIASAASIFAHVNPPKKE